MPTPPDESCLCWRRRPCPWVPRGGGVGRPRPASAPPRVTLRRSDRQEVAFGRGANPCAVPCLRCSVTIRRLLANGELAGAVRGDAGTVASCLSCRSALRGLGKGSRLRTSDAAQEKNAHEENAELS